MRKVLLTLCLIAMTTATWGARALTTPFTVVQPDGTQLTVILHGDEDFSWYTTLDDILLVNENEHFLIAKVDEDGQLLSTNILAHNKELRKESERTAIALQEKSRFLEQVPAVKRKNMMRRISIGDYNPPYFPHVESPKAVVILVEFADSTFSMPNPRKTFNDYLNGEAPFTNEGFREDRNYGSVREYFNYVSDGQFTPQFDIYGPVKLPKELGYYGQDQGKNDKDININEMMNKACQLMNDSLDFSQYDANGDGYVDLVYFIYAGYSQSVGAPSYSIWPKSGLAALNQFDGKYVRRYGLNNELNYLPDYKFSAPPYKRINGIGLFCHEFSHTLGLPDLYAKDDQAKIDNQCMEYWDLMDYGEYTDNGYRPTPYTPWEKEVMGWVELEELTEPAIITMAEQDAYKITNSENKEYLILHNIQQNGWSGKMLGHGLLVYRIDYKKSSVNLSDYPNNTAGKPSVTVVAADGLLINGDNTAHTKLEHQQSHAGDPYPGSKNVTELLSVQMNETTIEKPLYDITEENGNITFKFLDKNLGTGIAGLMLRERNNEDKRIYTMDGQLVGSTLLNLPKGIYIQAGKKLVVR